MDCIVHGVAELDIAERLSLSLSGSTRPGAALECSIIRCWGWHLLLTSLGKSLLSACFL